MEVRSRVREKDISTYFFSRNNFVFHTHTHTHTQGEREPKILLKHFHVISEDDDICVIRIYGLCAVPKKGLLTSEYDFISCSNRPLRIQPRGQSGRRRMDSSTSCIASLSLPERSR